MLISKTIRTILIILFALQGILFAKESGMNKLTEITSDRLEIENREDGNYFCFYDNVKVLGENLSVGCSYLEVISDRVAKDKCLPMDSTVVVEKTTTAPQIGSIMQITAKGEVKIEQAGRAATCGLAEIFPREGKLVLTESPVLIDSNGRVEGHRIILFKDERRAIIDPYPEGGRTKVILSSIPDLGFKQGPKKEEQNNIETQPNALEKSSNVLKERDAQQSLPVDKKPEVSETVNEVSVPAAKPLQASNARQSTQVRTKLVEPRSAFSTKSKTPLQPLPIKFRRS